MGSFLQKPNYLPLKRKKKNSRPLSRLKQNTLSYLVAQDTNYVGNIKGVRCIYQQTVIDTYTKVAFAKLYDCKHSITAADVLNDKVIPFFEEQQIPVLRMLTDLAQSIMARQKTGTIASFI